MATVAKTCQVTWHFAASTWAASESPPWTSQRGSGSPTRRGIAPSGQDPHPQVYLGNRMRLRGLKSIVQHVEHVAMRLYGQHEANISQATLACFQLIMTVLLCHWIRILCFVLLLLFSGQVVCVTRAMT